MIDKIRAATLLLAYVLLCACGGNTSPEFDNNSPEPTPEQQGVQPTPEPVLPTPITIPTEAPNPEPTRLPVPDPIVQPTAIPSKSPVPTPTPSLQKGSANISWDIPEQRENGEDLTMSEIGGYEIIYRRTDEIIFNTVVIADQTVSAYLLENLDAGQYELMIAAFDSDGLYSDFSEPEIINIGG